MTVTATAKRRRRQATNGYKHLPPKQRPRYVARAKHRAELARNERTGKRGK